MSLDFNDIQLLDYWKILVRRRWVILLAVASVSITVLVGSFLATPLYRATVLLQIERQTPEIFTFRDLSSADTSWVAYDEFYQTQYAILASRAVARKAVNRLGLVNHASFESAQTKPSLLSRLRSMIPGGSEIEPDPVERAAAQVAGGLEIRPISGSYLSEVSWVSDDPELAAQVANAVADSFIEFNLHSQYSTSGQAESFLVNQIAVLKDEIGEREERLQKYGEARRIISIDDSNNITMRALQDISQRRTEAQTLLARTKAAYDSMLRASPDSLSAVMQSDLVARLRQEHASIEAEYSEKLRRFGEQWPGIQTLRSKLEQSQLTLDQAIERIAREIRSSAEEDYKRALDSVQNLGALLAQQEDAAQRLKKDAVEFTNLRVEVQKKRESLDALIRRKNEMSLSTRIQDPASVPTNIRVLEAARVPLSPFKPNKRTNLMLGLLFGASLGVGLAFLLNYVDNTLSSAADVEKILSLPVLTVVPEQQAGTGRRPRRSAGEYLRSVKSIDLISHVESRTAISEAYRELRTSILLSSPGHPPGRVMITSALPEEGKTATAINLAIVLAQLGRRVALVDADLRRPRQHEAFSLNNSHGASTYLSGLEQNLSMLLTPTGIDNLDLLTSGPVPPNPSELLNSSRFAEMGTALLEQGYDHVLFDSPPVLSVSDAVIIANTVDTCVMVVRAARTPRQSVRAAVDKFKAAGIGLLGIVLNGVQIDSASSAYYGNYEQQDTDDRQGESDFAERRRAGGA